MSENLYRPTIEEPSAELKSSDEVVNPIYSGEQPRVQSPIIQPVLSQGEKVVDSSVQSKGPHIVLTNSSGTREFRPEDVGDFGEAGTWCQALDYLYRKSI